MISRRARIMRTLLMISLSKHGYDVDRIQEHRKKFARNVSTIFPQLGISKLQHTRIAGVNTIWFMSPTVTNRTIIYIHGGGFTFGSSKTHAQHTTRLAKLCKANVLAVDYSLAPENQFPVALNELQNVWLELIDQGLVASKAIIMGESAGGNLSMALSLKLRDMKLVQPACVVLLSPALDAHFSGESYTLNENIDPVLTKSKLDFFVESYIGSASKNNPLLSPIYANLKNLPPILIQVGTDELLLSDSETFYKNALRDGANVKLDIGEGMWHGWQLFATYIPEANASIKTIAAFVDRHTR